METVTIGLRINTSGLSEDESRELISSTSWKVERLIIEMQDSDSRIKGYSLTFSDLAEWAAAKARAALVKIWLSPADAKTIAAEALSEIGPMLPGLE